MTRRNRRTLPAALPGWAKDYSVGDFAWPGVGTVHPHRLVAAGQPLPPPTIEAVALGGDTPRRGPRDPKAWADWYKRGDVYRMTTRASVGSWTSATVEVSREVTLGPTPLEMHREMMREARPDAYWVEVGKQLRKARKDKIV